MPRHPPSADTLDLFADLPEAARRAVRKPAIAVRPSPAPAPTQQSPLEPLALAALSDSHLAAVVANSAQELRQRMSAAAGPNVDRLVLQRAAQTAARALVDLSGDSPRRSSGKVQAPVAMPTGLHDSKRSAVRAALKAGVKPGQVAKHFGMPLAMVRQIAAYCE
jgi:hypothetical protein